MTTIWDGVQWSVLGQHHGLSRVTVHVQALKDDGLVDLEMGGPDGRNYATLTPLQARRIAESLNQAAQCIELQDRDS